MPTEPYRMLSYLIFRYGKYALLLGIGLLPACSTVPTRPLSEPIAITDSPPLAVEDLVFKGAEPALREDGIPKSATPIVERALSALGTRYRYGGNSPEEGFDCSGFVRWVYHDLANALPRSALALSQVEAPIVKPKSLSIGDLLFFRIRQSSGISHVGIYLGDGKFVHAPKPGQQVRIESLHTPWWQKRFALARRWLGTLIRPK